MADRKSHEEAKFEAAVGTRILSELGLASGLRASLGHTSMRVPGDPDKFYVKGRGYRVDVLERMRPEDMVLCDLDGNWLDGPVNSLQCSEVKIHSCILRARPDVVSVTHVHPDYAVLLSTLGLPIKPMAQEGAGLVIDPLPVLNQTKIITSDAEGEAVVKTLGSGNAMLLLGHGAVTVSTQSVQGSVMAMVHIEHQARLTYLAMSVSGPDHKSIPRELAEAVSQSRPGDEPHIKARLANIEGGRGGEGIWGFYKEVVSSSM
jgi:L-fuculose-phosphate aldolase